MRNLVGRIERLEEAAGLGPEPKLYLITRCLGDEFALDTDRCLEILEDSGLVAPGPIATIDFMNVPSALSAAQLERYLREHAREICGGGLRERGPEICQPQR